MVDPYNLERFVAAQDAGGIYDRAVGELREGRKRSHWMWFVFPQIAGLGQSAMSREFAISSIEEARAYLRHPVLGPRLIECAGIVAAGPGRSAADVFGGIDAQKLQSSMTLFRRAMPETPEFEAVLDRYFEGQPDPATEGRL
ncbi:MAG TPA: DUF1810 domain-containing protein [Acidimicrobiales bacterium]|nr:DUF1810 domain-containing protein [Acidimicrobiales bacterium]